MHKHNKQSGRSMVEMLGVLAIVAVLSVGGIAGYSKAMAKYRISRTLDEIQMLVTGIRSLYSSSSDYTGLSSNSIDKLGILPSSIKVTRIMGPLFYNSFGGRIPLVTWNVNQGFVFSYNNLPKNACIQLATADWGGSAASGLVGINISSSNQTFLYSITPANSWTNGNLPLSINDASALCTSNNNNSIAWVYR